MMFAVAGIVAFRPFWGPGKRMDPDRPVQGEAPWPMVTGPLLLAVAGIAFGLAPEPLQIHVITPIVASLLGDPALAKPLLLWTGVNTALILSILTFATGILLYALHLRIRAGLARFAEVAPDSDVGWDRFLAGFLRLATWQTRILQGGVMRGYLMTIFGVLAAGLIFGMSLSFPDLSQVRLPDLQANHWAVFLIILAATALVAATRSRITAIAGLGVVGIGVALIFILFGAPDVAITQLLVETLIVVLFAVAALRLPLLPSRREVKSRPLDFVFAVFVGTMVAIVLMSASSGPLDLRLTEFFETASWPKAFGRNIVNVILVDFRALDTFGEVAVVAIAALSAVALLRQRITRGPRP